VVTWVLALAAGGPDAPRVRITTLHLAIGAFLAVAATSVVLNAHELNRALEFELSFKRLLLLSSYVAMFVVIASVVRPSEVPAFLKFTLVLGVLCAIGTIWEYRYQYNVFYDLAERLLPGAFEVGNVDPTAVDGIGRSVTRGPAEHPLEATAMLTMALPIALVGLLGNRRRRDSLLYGLAACLLIAAAISTYRKSALLAPAAVVLTLICFRRRDILRLAPLGAVAGLLIHFLSPGAFGSILAQLRPDRLSVGTVSDRASDYDAIRPDLWSHLAFGRGYGSYDHHSYRILDSEVLGRLVETGLLGLLCFVVMVIAITVCARRPIRSRDAVASPAALAVAASAAAFLVVSFLYDSMGFPHGPYILLSLAAFLAVLVVQGRAPAEPFPPIDRAPDDEPVDMPRERVVDDWFEPHDLPTPAAH
jgi:hypothetical protein